MKSFFDCLIVCYFVCACAVYNDAGSRLQDQGDRKGIWSPCNVECGGGLQRMIGNDNAERRCNMFPCPVCDIIPSIKFGVACIQNMFLTTVDLQGRDGLFCYEECKKVLECELFSFNIRTGDCTFFRGNSDAFEEGGGTSISSLIKIVTGVFASPKDRTCAVSDDDYVSGEKFGDYSGCGIKKGTLALPNTAGSNAVMQLKEDKLVGKHKKIYSVMRSNLLADLRPNCQVYENTAYYSGTYHQCDSPIVFKSVSSVISVTACQKILNEELQKSVNLAVYRMSTKLCELLQVFMGPAATNHTQTFPDMSREAAQLILALIDQQACVIKENGVSLIIRGTDGSNCISPCLMSNWSEWSSCDGVSQDGWKARERKIISSFAPVSDCPHIRETRSCNDNTSPRAFLSRLKGVGAEVQENMFLYLMTQSFPHCIISDWGPWSLESSSSSCLCTGLVGSRPEYNEEAIPVNEGTHLNVEVRHRTILQNHIPTVGHPCSDWIKKVHSRCTPCIIDKSINQNLVGRKKKKGPPNVLASFLSESGGFNDDEESEIKQKSTLTTKSSSSNCVVGEWMHWSGCSAPCGKGTRFRYRKVTGNCEDNQDTFSIQNCFLQSCKPLSPSQKPKCDISSIGQGISYNNVTHGCDCPDPEMEVCSGEDAWNSFEYLKDRFIEYCWGKIQSGNYNTDVDRTIGFKTLRAGWTDLIRDQLPAEFLSPIAIMKGKIGLSHDQFVDCTWGFQKFGNASFGSYRSTVAARYFCKHGSYVLCKKKLNNAAFELKKNQYSSTVEPDKILSRVEIWSQVSGVPEKTFTWRLLVLTFFVGGGAIASLVVLSLFVFFNKSFQKFLGIRINSDDDYSQQSVQCVSNEPKKSAFEEQLVEENAAPHYKDGTNQIVHGRPVEQEAKSGSSTVQNVTV